MKIEIDQSGKIENTSKSTYIAFSNGKSEAVCIVAREKKKIQKYFRQIKKPRLFNLITFAVATFLLIKKHLEENIMIVIDIEYVGYEKFIGQKLRELIIENTRVKSFKIYFSHVGKKSNSHLVVYDAYLKKIKSRVLTSENILKILKKDNKKSGSI